MNWHTYPGTAGKQEHRPPPLPPVQQQRPADWPLGSALQPPAKVRSWTY